MTAGVWFRICMIVALRKIISLASIVTDLVIRLIDNFTIRFINDLTIKFMSDLREIRIIMVLYPAEDLPFPTIYAIVWVFWGEHTPQQ